MGERTKPGGRATDDKATRVTGKSGLNSVFKKFAIAWRYFLPLASLGSLGAIS